MRHVQVEGTLPQEVEELDISDLELKESTSSDSLTSMEALASNENTSLELEVDESFLDNENPDSSPLNQRRHILDDENIIT